MWWKNRVQPANSLQVKFFVSRALMGGELVAVPIFLSRRISPRAARAFAFVAYLFLPESRTNRPPDVAHAFLRAVSPFLATSSPFVAQALSPVAKRWAAVWPRPAAFSTGAPQPHPCGCGSVSPVAKGWAVVWPRPAAFFRHPTKTLDACAILRKEGPRRRHRTRPTTEKTKQSRFRTTHL